MTEHKTWRVLLLALLAAAACGGPDEKEAPLPNPVSMPGLPVAPVEGEDVAVTRVAAEGFEWPGTVEADSPRQGVVAATYSLDNPCRDTPLGAHGSLRGDTVALVLRWPRTDPGRSCTQEVTPDAFRTEMDGVPSGPRVVGVYQAIDGQTSAALSHTLELTVQ